MLYPLSYEGKNYFDFNILYFNYLNLMYGKTLNLLKLEIINQINRENNLLYFPAYLVQEVRSLIQVFQMCFAH